MQCLWSPVQVRPSSSGVPSIVKPELHPKLAFEFSQEDHRDEKERSRLATGMTPLLLEIIWRDVFNIVFERISSNFDFQKSLDDFRCIRKLL